MIKQEANGNVFRNLNSRFVKDIFLQRLHRSVNFAHLLGDLSLFYRPFAFSQLLIV